MGVICMRCRRDTERASGCVPISYLDGSGVRFDAIPVRVVGIMAPACTGCGAVRGEPHHQHCDQEECPRCGGQLVSCACALTWRPAAEGMH